MNRINLMEQYFFTLSFDLCNIFHVVLRVFVTATIQKPCKNEKKNLREPMRGIKKNYIISKKSIQEQILKKLSTRKT